MTAMTQIDIDDIIEAMPLEFRAAAKFANERHAGQFRGDGVTPYMAHPIMVAGTVFANYPDRRTAVIAALLHDTVEDTATTRQELELAFGKDVADLVQEVTDDTSLSASERKLRQRLRIPSYSDNALIIKFADKCINLIDIKENPPNWAPWKVDNAIHSMGLFIELAIPEMLRRGIQPMTVEIEDEDE